MRWIKCECIVIVVVVVSLIPLLPRRILQNAATTFGAKKSVLHGRGCGLVVVAYCK